MSTRGTSSAKTLGSSLRDSIHDSDVRTIRSRAESGTEFSLNIESSSHSYPKPPGRQMPTAYGQMPDAPAMRRDLGFYPSQPLTHALPGGSAAASPFVLDPPSAPGYPVQPYQNPAMISPLPYHPSNPFPAGYSTPFPQPAYTTSGAMYQPIDYNKRAATTGSYPLHHQGFRLTPPSTSYSTPLDQGAQQHQAAQHSKSNEAMADDCFNIFWLFFLLGPLTWPCGFFGVCSEKHSERLAGVVSGVCFVLVVIAAVIVITQAPADSNSDEGM